MSNTNKNKSIKVMIVKFLEMMSKYTDYNHRLTMKEIIRLYEKEYNESICRQSVTEYIDELKDIKIEIVHDKCKYYYSDENRMLSSGEVELLCHSVMSNYVIPLSYSKELIKKLIKTQSVEFENENKNLDFNIFNTDKRDNKELFLNFETISDAIDSDSYISFNYLKYNANKELINARSKPYKVLPIRTVSMQNRFYLIAYSDKYDNYSHYRIDKISNIKILEKNNRFIKLDPYAYTKNRLYMYSGEIEDYELEADEFIVDEIIDLFGKDVLITKIDDNYNIKVKTTKEAMIFFACQYIKHVKIISPEDIKKEMIDILKMKLNEYMS